MTLYKKIFSSLAVAILFSDIKYVMNVSYSPRMNTECHCEVARLVLLVNELKYAKIQDPNFQRNWKIVI